MNERLRLDVGILGQKRKDQQAAETPLMIAARNGQREVLRWLLEHGANAESENLQGKTAKAIAIECGQKDLVEDLESSRTS